MVFRVGTPDEVKKGEDEPASERISIPSRIAEKKREGVDRLGSTVPM